ncbi:MAG TPA: site-specific integrase [Polyangiales bacterium]|jgi:integrase
MDRIAQSAPKPKQYKRSRVRHPGVVLIKPRPERGKRFWSLRWRDVATQRGHDETLDGVTERRVAEPYAVRKSAELDAQKRAVAVSGQCAVRLIADEAAHYLDEASAAAKRGVNVGKPLSPATVRAYTDALDQFREWCTARGLRTLQDLTRNQLSEWRTHRRRTPTVAGSDRKLSSVNHSLKPVRQMLLEARASGRFESLDSDAINGALARYPEPKPVPRCYSVATVRAMLDRLNGDPMVGAAFAIALFGGLRRGEVSALTVKQVDLHARSDYDAGLTHPMLRDVTGKTGRRDVELLPYSPLLVELLAALTEDRKPHERLCDPSYEQLGNEAERLKRLGGDFADFNFKALRSTCASFQGPIPGDLKSKADRLGHTLAVAEEYYLALPRGTPRQASSLDALLRCEPEMRRLIEAIKQLRASRDIRSRRSA